MTSTKPYSIAKRTVWEAYQLVKANRGAAGVDDETSAIFEQNLSGNLYKLRNQVRLGAQRHKYFIKVPRGAGPAALRLHTLREASAKLIAPAWDRFVADDNPALEQQFFDITQAELKPEMPAYRATDDRRRKDANRYSAIR